MKKRHGYMFLIGLCSAIITGLVSFVLFVIALAVEVLVTNFKGDLIDRSIFLFFVPAIIFTYFGGRKGYMIGLRKEEKGRDIDTYNIVLFFLAIGVGFLAVVYWHIQTNF